jgi:hypothetical protein
MRHVKVLYTKGTKIKLIKMNDKFTPPSGTIGTVDFVDDIGQIHVKWESGGSLALIIGEDDFEVIEQK